LLCDVVHFDGIETLSIAIICQREFEPGCFSFAIPTREVWEERACRYMQNVLNFVVGGFVQARISAGCSRRKASDAGGFEFLWHTFSPLKMEVHDLLPLFLEALVNLVAGTLDGWSY
jgi:hypothetical protein